MYVLERICHLKSDTSLAEHTLIDIKRVYKLFWIQTGFQRPWIDPWIIKNCSIEYRLSQSPFWNTDFSSLLRITRNMGQDGDEHAHFDQIWLPNI